MAASTLDEMKAFAMSLDAELLEDDDVDTTVYHVGNEGGDGGNQQERSPVPPPSNKSIAAREKPSKAEKLKGIMQEGTELPEPQSQCSRGIEFREPREKKRKSEPSRDKPSKKIKNYPRELEVTAVPMDESFLKQTFEEWKVNPVTASVRVIAEVGRVHELWSEATLKEMKGQLDAALCEKSAAEQELASKDTALATTKAAVERLREERASMMKARDDALLKVVGLEN